MTENKVIQKIVSRINKMSNYGIFYHLARNTIKHSNQSHLGLRRFKGLFGLSPNICEIVWEKIKNQLPNSFEPSHLLWALLFLKCYNTEHVNHAIIGANEKTFRNRIWVIIEKLALINVVCTIKFVNHLHLFYNFIYFKRFCGKIVKLVLYVVRHVTLL